MVKSVILYVIIFKYLNPFIISLFNNFCVHLGPLMTLRWYASGHILFLCWGTFSVMKWRMSWMKNWLLLVISSSTCKYYLWRTNLALPLSPNFSIFAFWGLINYYYWSLISISIVWYYSITISIVQLHK